MTTAGRELVLVYGTLRRGGSNHFRMAGAEFIAGGTIRGRMYRFDWYPGLVLDAGGEAIIGEVYAVDARLLEDLDLFEGVSAGEIEGSEYRRVRTEVTHDKGTMCAWVWEWLGSVAGAEKITGGDWLKVPGV